MAPSIGKLWLFALTMMPLLGPAAAGRAAESSPPRVASGAKPLVQKASVTAGVGQFGIGWGWLVQDDDSLKIVKTSNADTPVAHGQNVLLACDV